MCAAGRSVFGPGIKECIGGGECDPEAGEKFIGSGLREVEAGNAGELGATLREGERKVDVSSGVPQIEGEGAKVGDLLIEGSER